MADLTTRITRKFQLYIWCMVFISLRCLSAKCLNVDISVNLYPEGTLKIKYGEPLELFCVTDSNYSASDIHFINGRNNKNMDSDIVNSTTRRLYIAMPEKQLTTFYCRNNKTKKVCLARVLVDSPPSDVTDFNCISKNVDILNCSWTRQPSFSIIRYTLTYSVNTLPVNPPCVPTQIESTVYCVWKTNSMPRYRQQEETQFFDMTACNAVGCNSQNFTVDHFSIVKPDSPYELKILKYGTHSVYLEWKISHNIVDFLSCGVDHIIQYQLAKVDNGTHFRTVDTSNLPARNRTYRFHLMDLPYAHMQYDLRIYIKSKMAKSRQYWSDFAYKHFTTLSEEPMRPPTIISGAFDQYTRGNERVINVYWQEIAEIEEGGPNFKYLVLVAQGNLTQMIHHRKGMYLSLNATPNALDITAWSSNVNGSSLNSSHIYIPSEKDTHYLKVSYFTKVVYENGTYELSWDSVKNIDNYTLFWCEHNGNQICNGRIDFAVLDSGKTRHIIDLPLEFKYQFAISAISGKNSGGMTWAKIYKECNCSLCIHTDHRNNK